MSKITGNEVVYANGMNSGSAKGMNLRQHFAVVILNGILASCQGFDVNDEHARHMAECAVKQADALITALNDKQ